MLSPAKIDSRSHRLAKTTAAQDLMAESPSGVSEDQLWELRMQ